MAQPVALAYRLEAIASHVHSLAFDAADDHRTMAATEALHEAVERAADDLRATVRGVRRVG